MVIAFAVWYLSTIILIPNRLRWFLWVILLRYFFLFLMEHHWLRYVFITETLFHCNGIFYRLSRLIILIDNGFIHILSGWVYLKFIIGDKTFNAEIRVFYFLNSFGLSSISTHLGMDLFLEVDGILDYCYN